MTTFSRTRKHPKLQYPDWSLRFCVFLTIAIVLGVHSTILAAEDATSTTLLTSPPAPILTPVNGGAIEPHSDYVRVTYVSARGETLPSPETVYSAGAKTLTVVHSPPAEPGAIGYNVYAIQNNGGSGTGHLRQNAKPIAIGTDFTEPSTGWAQSHIVPPTVDDAFVPSEISVAVKSTGGYVEAPTVNGTRAALIVPSNDAPPGTTLSLASDVGLPKGAPGPRTVSAAVGHKPVVLQTIRFEFNKNVSILGLPTFKFTMQHDMLPHAPYVLELFDGTSGTLLATVPASVLWDITFESDYHTPFHAAAGRAYFAEIVGGPPSGLITAITSDPRSIMLPSAGGVSLSVELPAATVGKDSKFNILASVDPPVGLPALTGADVRRVLYYGNIMVTGTAVYCGPITLKVAIPSALKSVTDRVRLTAFDAQFAEREWAVRIAPTKNSNGELTFSAAPPKFIGWRRYGIALYESAGLSDAAFASDRQAAFAKRSATHGAHLVVVLGDSFSRLTIISPSGPGCVPGWLLLPDCQYSLDPKRSWPGALAAITGDDVRNLSLLGTETTVDNFAGESMLTAMVPQIPVNARVVICQCGFNDLARNQSLPSTSSRAIVVTKAILTRAPHARIVYVGVRCFTDCVKAGVDAWNTTEMQLAANYGGAFVDLTSIGVDGASPSFPDGSHPNPAMARLIAARTAAAIASLKLEGW